MFGRQTEQVQHEEPQVRVDVTPTTARDAHQLETLGDLQRAESLFISAQKNRERAVTFEEEAKEALDKARTAHKRLIS